MSITRLQQARQMYALGQLVSKTMDGSRPGYRGDNAYGGGRSSGPAGGASSGGNYGGNTGGNVGGSDQGHSRFDVGSGYYGEPTSTTTTNNNTGPDIGFQNALNTAAKRQATIKASQNPNYGQFFGSNVPTYQTPTFGQRIGQGVGNLASGVVDFYKQGGMLGLVGRGVGSLLGGIFGPRYETSNREKGIMNQYKGPGGSTLSIGRNSPPEDRGGEGGQDSYILPLYAQDNTIEDIDGDGIISLQDIVLRFQGADRTLDPSAVGLQDTDQLREVIQERVKNLYT